MRQRRVSKLAKRLAVLILATSILLPLVFVFHSHRLLTRLDEGGFLEQQQQRLMATGGHQSNRTIISTKGTSNAYKPAVSSSELPFHWLDGCLRPTASTSSTAVITTPPTGIVTILATGTDDTPQVQRDNFRRICKAIPTQVEFFLEPQGMDMLFLVEEAEGSYECVHLDIC